MVQSTLKFSVSLGPGSSRHIETDLDTVRDSPGRLAVADVQILHGARDVKVGHGSHGCDARRDARRDAKDDRSMATMPSAVDPL